MKPKYKHDCTACVFLFHRIGADWYHCPRCDGGTLVARVGDEGSKYWSSSVSMIKRWLDYGFDATDIGNEAKKIVKELKLGGRSDKT